MRFWVGVARSDVRTDRVELAAAERRRSRLRYNGPVGWGGIRTVAVGVLGTLVACGPASEPRWSIAVMRTVEGDYPHNRRVWLVDDDGQGRAAPQLPESESSYAPSEWIGWSPDGSEIIFRQADRLWRWDGEGMVDAPFVNPRWSIGEVRTAAVFDDGSVVARIHVNGGAIPGLYAWDESSLVFADAPGDSAELLTSAHALDMSFGAGPTVLWTSWTKIPDPEMEVDEEPETHRRHGLFRGGRRTDLDGPQDAKPTLSPTGEQIAWAGPSAMVLTDLDGRELGRIEAVVDSIAWRPDGRVLAGNDATSVWTYAVDTAELERLEVPMASSLAWSPSGDRLAIETSCEMGQRRIHVFEDGEEVWSRACDEDFFTAWAPDGSRFAVTRLGRTSGSVRIHVVGGEAGEELEGDFLAFRPE